jgi:signal transduction histidine kinase
MFSTTSWMGSPIHFDPVTGLRMLAFVYALLSIAMWALFKRMNASSSSLNWTYATGSAAIGIVLLSMRSIAPVWAAVYLANIVLFATYATAVHSLRGEVGMPDRRTAILAFVVLAAVAFLGGGQISVSVRVQTGAVVHALGAGLLAFTGWQAMRLSALRSVKLIAGAYLVYALMFVLLAASLIIRREGAPPLTVIPNLALLVALLAGTGAGLYGSFGYVGMAIERLRAHDIQQAADLSREAAQRGAAEQMNAQLQRWLAERDDLVRVLAHEVRQPLNNASAALQSARAALAPQEQDRRTQPTAVEHRVQRAQSVLGQVIGSLDNTLAATALLASPDRVAQQDTDIDLLIQLSLGDLDPKLAPRVQFERLTHTRTAMMDAGLMRLALRNLLANALAYSDADSPVVLRISDSDEPLALVFEVMDSGPGVAPELATRLFRRGERGNHELPGHGLGLYVVLRVAELHESTVEMQHREGGGSVFRLALAQGRG